jgi:hypothetical protein
VECLGGEGRGWGCFVAVEGGDGRWHSVFFSSIGLSIHVVFLLKRPFLGRN